MGRCAQVCLSITVVVFAIIAAVWQRYLVNPLEYTPVDLAGKTIVVTGATEGIGKESAKMFAKWGASTLILPVRSEKKGQETRKEILEFAKGKNVNVEVYPDVDFADFSTVRTFAEKIQGRAVDVLLNNAGFVQIPVEKTVDGIEKMFQVNHLSPFLLTYLLLPSLRLAKSPRVVFVSSAAHYMGHVGREKYSKENLGMKVFLPNNRYDDSKVMNILCAKGFADHFGKDGKITFNAVHPGFVVSNLDSNLPIAPLILAIRKLIGRDTNQGAMAQVTVATHPKLEGVTGRYFSDHCMNFLCQAPCFLCDSTNAPGAVTTREASDKDARDWLWKLSCDLTGVKC